MTPPKKANPAAIASPEKVRVILDLLERHYPDATCSLDFRSPLELLIATILSAQCTDERVNIVTPALFEKHPTAKSYAETPLEELENEIRSTGFYRNKAKNIQECCRQLEERFGGRVPADMDALVALPGIGRKTANVVLGNAYGVPGIVVDTHVGRVSQRLGLSASSNPDRIEQDLMAILDKSRWTLFSHQIVQHGRRVCNAKKPKCGECFLNPCCDYYRARTE
ncbi:MAG: endonuclease III [Syntrophobacteraceae bacterium]